ncbi:MAG: hypothetical protein VW438_00270 [Euryarchaeota archaeon]
MKWVLTIYICSVIGGDCYIPGEEVFEYQKDHPSHAECVKNGLGETFELLFDGKVFTQEQINKFEIYPKFSCIKQKITDLNT